jgi:hypothetical protein
MAPKHPRFSPLKARGFPARTAASWPKTQVYPLSLGLGMGAGSAPHRLSE